MYNNERKQIFRSSSLPQTARRVAAGQSFLVSTRKSQKKGILSDLSHKTCSIDKIGEESSPRHHAWRHDNGTTNSSYKIEPQSPSRVEVLLLYIFVPRLLRTLRHRTCSMSRRSHGGQSTLLTRGRRLSRLSTRNTHKFGIRLPHSVHEAVRMVCTAAISTQIQSWDK